MSYSWLEVSGGVYKIMKKLSLLLSLCIIITIGLIGCEQKENENVTSVYRSYYKVIVTEKGYQDFGKQYPEFDGTPFIESSEFEEAWQTLLFITEEKAEELKKYEETIKVVKRIVTQD
jgi:hypothetical protein